MTIGACATAGGVQALRNFADVDEFLVARLRPARLHLDARDSTPIAAHVPVDFELRGCPIDKRQLLEVISALLNHRRPAVARAQRLHRVQAARDRLRDGRPRHAVPRAGHARRAAARCARPTTAAATAASGRWSRRTPRAQRPDAGARARRARPRARLPHLQRGRRAVPRGERGRTSGGRSTSPRSRASRARVRCTSASRRHGRGRAAAHLRAAALLRGVPARPRVHRGARTSRRASAGSARSPTRSSAVRAMEDACGVAIDDGPIRALRRLLYCGEWLESHALHVYMLHAPDFLGYESAIAMARDHREIVERGLRLKKAGNALMARVGGREIHPVNVRVGGFYRAPTRRGAAAGRRAARGGARGGARDRGVDGAAAVPRVRARPRARRAERRRRVPDRASAGSSPATGSTSRPASATSTSPRSRSPTRTRSTPASATARRVPRRAARALHPQLRRAVAGGPRGALAAPASGRSAATRSRASSCAASRCCTPATRRCGSSPAYEPPDPPAVEVPPRAGVGYGGSEAPRGLLWHRYEIDDEGTILDARIVPPTSQNQLPIEQTCARSSQRHVEPGRRRAARRCEQAIRNYDPCISCATHFLTLDVDRA